ncbi:3488_t:CDS:2, partial [Ambispora leptoticha]
THQDDISHLLILNKKTQNIEPQLFATELEKFTPYRHRITASIHHQQALLQELTGFYKNLMEGNEARALQNRWDQIDRKRKEVSERFKKAKDAYLEVKEGIRKGIQFYIDLSDLIENLSKTAHQFEKKRQEERNELIQYIENQESQKANKQLNQLIASTAASLDSSKQPNPYDDIGKLAEETKRLSINNSINSRSMGQTKNMNLESLSLTTNSQIQQNNQSNDGAYFRNTPSSNNTQTNKYASSYITPSTSIPQQNAPPPSAPSNYYSTSLIRQSSLSSSSSQPPLTAITPPPQQPLFQPGPLPQSSHFQQVAPMPSSVPNGQQPSQAHFVNQPPPQQIAQQSLNQRPQFSYNHMGMSPQQEVTESQKSTPHPLSRPSSIYGVQLSQPSSLSQPQQQPPSPTTLRYNQTPVLQQPFQSMQRPPTYEGHSSMNISSLPSQNSHPQLQQPPPSVIPQRPPQHQPQYSSIQPPSFQQQPPLNQYYNTHQISQGFNNPPPQVQTQPSYQQTSQYNQHTIPQQQQYYPQTSQGLGNHKEILPMDRRFWIEPMFNLLNNLIL